MSHADLTVYSGSTHEADRRLTDVSKVKQYAFTAMLLNMQTPAVFRNGRPTQSMRYWYKEMPCVWNPLTMTPFPIQKHCRWRIYPIEYIGLWWLVWLLIQPNQINICPLRVRNKMFIHVSINVIAIVYNTVIVAKSHVFFSISHTSVLSNSPKWCHAFLLNSLGEFSFSCWIAFCVINSYILTTKLILYLIL